MKRPSFVSGILAALFIALLALAATAIISSVVHSRAESPMIITLVALAYGGYLLLASGPTPGRLVLGVIGCSLAFFSVIGTMGLLTVLFMQGLWVWSVRWICYQRTFLGAILDGSLLWLGLATAALVESYTQGVFLTVWSALLIQSLFVFIPESYAGLKTSADGRQSDSRFERSLRAANLALKQMDGFKGL